MTPSEILSAANELTPQKAKVWLSAHANKSEEAYGELWRAMSAREYHRRKLPDNSERTNPCTVTLDAKRDMLRLFREGFGCAEIAERVGVSKAWVWECIKSAERMERGEVTTQEAAEMLNVSRPTIVRWIKRGLLTARWERKSRVVRTADVMALAGR